MFACWRDDSRSITKLVESVIEHPELASLIVSIRFPFSSPSVPVPTTLTSDQARTFLGSLRNLQQVSLTGSTVPRSQHDSSKFFLHTICSTTLLIVAAILVSTNVVSIGAEWADRSHQPISPPTTVPCFKVTQLSLEPDDPCFRYYRGGETYNTGYISVRFGTSEPPSLDPTAHCSDPGTPARLGPSPLFAELNRVFLVGASSQSAAPLLDVLPQFPIWQIKLDIQNIVPTASLLALISPTILLPELRTIDLNFPHPVGRIGTRIGALDLDEVFSRLDFETNDIFEEVLPDNWQYPQYLPDLPVDDLFVLRDRIWQTPFQSTTGNLFRAIELQQALNEDKALLEEKWEQWKNNRKKSRGQRKQRK